jgi:uncharacterized FlaG/YvyC family protein
MLKIINLFKKLNESLNEEIPLFESDLTYYELRRFLTLIYRTVKDKDTKDVIANILKALAVLELKRMPVPTIKKLKSTSPKIFGD